MTAAIRHRDEGVSSTEGHFLRGVICTLTGGTLWGFSGACAQFLISTYDVAPMTLTAVRMLGSGVLFLCFMLATKRPMLKAVLGNRKVVARVAIFGVFGLFLSQITYTIVISYTNAGTATVLQCTGIVFVMVFACLVSRRIPRLREAIGLALAVVSTFLLATHGDLTSLAIPLPGLIWGVANGLACAFYIVYPQRLLREWGAVTVTGLGMLIGGVVAALIAQPWTTSLDLDGAGIIAFVAIIVLGTFAAFTLYLQGVADIGPVKASLLGAIEPVSATVFSWLWLKTQFPLIDWIGFALMIAMVFFVTVERKGQREAPEIREKEDAR